MPARPTPTPHPLTGSPVHAAALATLLAFLVRASWFLFVQQPGDALFSDMKGYIGRAANLLGGHDSLACFPPGTQYFYAAEMLVFGPAGLAAMGWVHALLGSATVGLWTLTAGHALWWRLAPAIVGGVLAWASATGPFRENAAAIPIRSAPNAAMETGYFICEQFTTIDTPRMNRAASPMSPTPCRRKP